MNSLLVPIGSNFIDPVVEYDHGDGCSVTGGTVYRGGAIPSLSGAYVYTDFCSGTLWAATPVDGSPATATVIGSIPGNPSSIAEDHDGELYATGLFAGALYKLVPGSGAGAESFPQTLSATGLFSDTAALTPNPGLIPYAPNAEFWSDGTTKQRWFAIPNGTQIAFSANGAWTWPVGAVTVSVVVPARAAENCWPTAVARPWNSGIATNWIPTYGTGFTVGWVGSAELIDSRVSLAKGAAFWYSGSVRMPMEAKKSTSDMSTTKAP